MNTTLSLMPTAHRKVNKAAQRGYDLVQLSLVITIIAIIAGAGFLIFAALSHNASEQRNANTISQIAGGLKKNLGSQNQYASVTTSMAVSQAIIPEDMKSNTAAPWTAANSYGGAITIVPNASGLSTPNDSATLTWPNVDGTECNDLVIATANVARQITVGSTVVKPTDSALNMASLATACDAASTSTIVYQIGR